MQLQRLALDQHRLERLNAQAMQRRRAVQHDRMILDHALQNVPDLGAEALDGALGLLDIVVGSVHFDQLLNDEGLEQLQRHFLRQAALIQLQARADDDNRTARIVDALAQQVLAEAALLAAQGIGQALQRASARAGDRAAAATVVDQRVHGFLQHALFIAHDDFRRVHFQHAL